MTVSYIGRSWDLNPRIIDEAAGLPLPEDGHPFTLAEITRTRGVSIETVIAEVEAALATLRAGEGRSDGPDDTEPLAE